MVQARLRLEDTHPALRGRTRGQGLTHAVRRECEHQARCIHASFITARQVFEGDDICVELAPAAYDPGLLMGVNGD